MKTFKLFLLFICLAGLLFSDDLSEGKHIELVDVRILGSQQWEAHIIIKNNSKQPIYFGANQFPNSEKFKLVNARYDQLVDGEWREIVVYKGGGYTGQKLTVQPGQEKKAFLLLNEIRSKLSFPSTIRIRVFCNSSDQPIISNSIVLLSNGATHNDSTSQPKRNASQP